MNKQKIIIDTDPGIDDAMAVFFAGLSEKLDLVAMTSVFGNVTLDIATRNAMVLAEILNQNIPVSEGFSKPLVQRPNPVSDYVHGKEGFGDIPARFPKAKPTKRLEYGPRHCNSTHRVRLTNCIHWNAKGLEHKKLTLCLHTTRF